jgi:hypothetical protein
MAAAVLGGMLSADGSGAVWRPAAAPMQEGGGGPDLPQPYDTGASSMACWGSSTFQALSPELETLAAERGLRYFNGGVGGQTAEQILARLGSRPVLMEAATLPASGSVVLTTQSLGNAPFSADGILAGIPGTLSKTVPSQHGYSFRRHVAGRASPLRPGSPFLPDKGAQFRAGINHLNIGKNNLTGTRRASIDPDVILHWTHTAYDWLTAAGAHVLVWGHFVNTGTAESSPVRERINRVNSGLSARYGRRYVDMEALLTQPGVWDLTGFPPTSADLQQQAIGNKPPSLSRNSRHLNAAGYAVLGRVAEERLDELAWLPRAKPASTRRITSAG